MRVVILTVLLYGFWLLLSGTFYAWLLIVGALSVLLIVYIARRMEIVDDEGLPLRLTLGTFTYWPWLAKEIFKSALKVTRIILDPKLPIAPTMVRVKSTQRTAAGLTTFANSIILTPGTISVEVLSDEKEILVHAVTEDFARDLEDGTLDRRVSKFEGSG